MQLDTCSYRERVIRFWSANIRFEERHQAQLNRLFMVGGLQGMMEGKNYKSVESFFFLVLAVVSVRCTWPVKEAS